MPNCSRADLLIHALREGGTWHHDPLEFATPDPSHAVYPWVKQNSCCQTHITSGSQSTDRRTPHCWLHSRRLQ